MEFGTFAPWLGSPRRGIEELPSPSRRHLYWSEDSSRCRARHPSRCGVFIDGDCRRDFCNGEALPVAALDSISQNREIAEIRRNGLAILRNNYDELMATAQRIAYLVHYVRVQCRDVGKHGTAAIDECV